jgi:hypothetical protein
VSEAYSTLPRAQGGPAAGYDQGHGRDQIQKEQSTAGAPIRPLHEHDTKEDAEAYPGPDTCPPRPSGRRSLRRERRCVVAGSVEARRTSRPRRRRSLRREIRCVRRERRCVVAGSIEARRSRRLRRRRGSRRERFCFRRERCGVLAGSIKARRSRRPRRPARGATWIGALQLPDQPIDRRRVVGRLGITLLVFVGQAASPCPYTYPNVPVPSGPPVVPPGPQALVAPGGQSVRTATRSAFSAARRLRQAGCD